jgi:hypothetical protein
MAYAQYIDTFIVAAKKNPALHWYAIADSAQHSALPSALTKTGGESRCLLDAPKGSPLAANAPHFVALSPPDMHNPSWMWICRNGGSLPCVTVLASELDFDPMFNHLQQFTEIVLPDGEDMFFAFWDPSILATLLGQTEDPTLHVMGPVLNEKQRATLIQGIDAWWYWDRNGALRSLDMLPLNVDLVDTPFGLTQHQVDDLVEASVPDHVLAHIALNQPQLLNGIEPFQRYGIVQRHIVDARDIKLESMNDLVNYVCAALIYKEQMNHDETILALLNRVKQGELKFSEALEQMP